jgi:hypothetical protein
VMGWDVLRRQETFLAWWVEHNAGQEVNNESHYKLGFKAIARLNKVHEVPQC